MWNIDEFLSGLNIDLDRLRDVFTYDPQAPMIFSSGIFLWLFVAFILVYLLLQRRTTARLLFVTLFSYYFYYKSSGTYFFLLGLVTVCDFFIARLMAREAIPWLRKAWVVLSLFINLGLLCYFKYTNFLGETFASLTGGTFTTMDIFLPVGISFFTFQSLSYTIDVYRRQITPLTSLLDYAFYVSFFPQLVAGPIVRARDFIPQIRRPLFVSNEMFGRGIFLIVSGLFKKAVISDYISVNFVERIFDNLTVIWLSALPCCWASISISISIPLISPLPLRNFGGGGIFRFPAGCAITFIFLWEATGRGKSANMPISSLPCSWAACGMALRGILYFGE